MPLKESHFDQTFIRVARARSTSAGYCCPSPPPRRLLPAELLPCLMLPTINPPPPVFPASRASLNISCKGVPSLTACTIEVATESDMRHRTRKDRRTFGVPMAGRLRGKLNGEDKKCCDGDRDRTDAKAEAEAVTVSRPKSDV